MAFGKIPRFSPSFSPAEAWICTKHLIGAGEGPELVGEFEATFAAAVEGQFGQLTARHRPVQGKFSVASIAREAPGAE